eukprot:CAMPEP_0176480504 /NCGR_PEP_ID=MMETSP0200_2-20121128/2314_1 /TAXON_ID=947934 /ORGANISM="Chaetoceros sp., Strain GSL56" /LENGTH=319 /DNA_ID=CAMNT_0017876631 /DNA_START=284 /DNA_END=1243 /DNA_ORIENTATION=+
MTTFTATASILLLPLDLDISRSNAMAMEKIPERSKDEPSITHKVTLQVRISRADGTFYTRAETEPPTPDNQVFTGSIILGLYGNLAPNHVERFMSYVDVLYSPADDSPLPSYARSQFPSLDQSTGLLTGGYIPGLHLTSFAGSSALEYGGRITPSKLWLDEFQDSIKDDKQMQQQQPQQRGRQKISHTRAGLLTHRNLEVLPTFGITTRSCPELDGAYTVFGTVLSTESSNEFLSRCLDLPTYSLDRPATVSLAQESSSSSSSYAQSRAVEEVASSIYSFQKDFFRSAAKTFGDTRLDNVYEGKILRRVEVTSVSWEKV